MTEQSDTDNDLIPCTEEQFYTALARSGYIDTYGRWIGQAISFTLGGKLVITWVHPVTSQHVARAVPTEGNERLVYANPTFMET